ncbi:uncharacterized protein [Nicotiana sylvestris]|uniref:uncharacterized protein n=1 Tax=Nicotiana sylvestris TaxID=4096 RepID=UPI00388CCE32
MVSFCSLFIATHWLPGEIPDLAEWSHKLAAFLTYDRRRWRDLSKGRWEVKHHGAESLFEARLNSMREEERLLASVLGDAGKRKDAPRCEKAYGEAPFSQQLRGSDSVDRQFFGISVSSYIASAFGEAQPFGLMTFDRLKAKLLHYEAPLRDARDREKSLRHLCAAKESELISLRRDIDQSRLKGRADELEKLWGEVGKAKREFIELQAHVNAHSEAKERAQTGASALKAQIQAARANDSARAKMIIKLSSELSRAKTEMVNVRAEVVMINSRARQKMTAYLRSVVAAKAELQKTLDRAKNSKEYVRCRARREIFKEIHARGFDLSGEIEQAKGEEHDAKFLLSDAEDDGEETAGL